MTVGSWWAVLLGLILSTTGGLQKILPAEDVQGLEKNGGMELLVDAHPLLKAYAIEPNKSACKDCCPRPKATVTVTETGHMTVTCTHTRSSDRTQLTTVRFTSTITSLATKTEKVNFINTTTIVVSRQVTYFSTTEAARYRVFTKTQTVFTSFAIATVIRTTRVPSTRLVSTLVFTTTTSTVFTTLTSQSVVTSTSLSTISINAVTLIITTVLFDITSTVTSTTVELGATTLPNSPISIIRSVTSSTSTLILTSFYLGTETIDNQDVTDYVFTIAVATSFVPVTTNTANVVDYTSGLTTLTFSQLYPITVVT